MSHFNQYVNNLSEIEDYMNLQRSYIILLRSLLKQAKPENMGGTPDLVCPEGHRGEDPWGDWEDSVKALLNQIDKDLKY